MEKIAELKANISLPQPRRGTMDRAFALALLPCYAFAAPASDAVPKLPGWDKPLHNYASASGMRSQ